jgi:N-acetylglucosamine kinase-like BadF-type ATPase
MVDLVSVSVLGVDVGKGACRARWSAEGTDESVGFGPGVPHMSQPGAPETIVEAIVAAVDDAGAPRQGIDTVCAGVTGLLEADRQAAHLARLLLDALGARCAIVTGDVVTSHAGALDGGAGVVVSAGTGSVALGVDPSGRHAKVDGQGYILGDQGSGFAVGRRGLASAMRHHDGRGGSAALAALAERDYGPLDRLAADVYASDNPPAFVARFAPAVAEAARAGDADAVAIWADVADELAIAATAAFDRLDWSGDDVPLSWTGRLFDAGDVLLDRFIASVAERAPSLTPQPPLGDSLSGAVALARLGTSALHRDLLHIERR